ncbi:MAG: hypothetical protein LUF35_04535 [Lachnospiraceae bacterium]|nr:hypothetical protein [Lachnospiraceae bacterium]
MTETILKRADYMEETEEFVSGFCKKQNQTRMVLCEFGLVGDGRRVLLAADCAYGMCEYSRACTLMASVRRNADSGGGI